MSTVDRAAWSLVQRTDFTVYTAAGRAILDHTDLYLAQSARGWRYVYPPPFAILMVPLTYIPVALGALIWYVLEVLSIGASVWMSARLLPVSLLDKKHYLLYGLPLLSLSVLLVSGAMRCQASPFMFFLMIATFYFHFKGHPIASGFSLAAATLIKVFPITLVMYFAIRGQWRNLCAMVVGLLILGIVLPSMYWGWQFNLHQIGRWLEVVGQPAMMSNTDRAGLTTLYEQLLNTTKPRNQSLESLFLSWNISASFVHILVGGCAFLMFMMMWLSARHIKRTTVIIRDGFPSLEEGLLCSAFIIWSLLITPISETHYFGALLMPLILLIGYVVHRVPEEADQKYYFTLGSIIMVAVMVMIGIESVAVWRPLCIVSLLLWFVCIYLIWRPYNSYVALGQSRLIVD
ncbi:MAG: DUF2029 domain-containing protein [Gammaproteobacteria bacterium]|nr:DUF2029 domain-containing protein [Gammaproteobacteria bacterium]